MKGKKGSTKSPTTTLREAAIAGKRQAKKGLADEFLYAASRKKQYGIADNSLNSLLTIGVFKDAKEVELICRGEAKIVTSPARVVKAFASIQITECINKVYSIRRNNVFKGTPDDAKRLDRHASKLGVVIRVGAMRIYTKGGTVLSFTSTCKPGETPLRPFIGKQLVMTGINRSGVIRFDEEEVERIAARHHLSSCTMTPRETVLTCMFGGSPAA